jgi:predicted unusual protein kinase regulating ubiquinone biosynthesis (AarF/ABC1/UbiB family)
VVTALRRKVGGTGGIDDGEDRQARAAERYARLLGRSRGVLMKAGQIMSFVSFGGVVDADARPVYQAALARLQDSAPPMPSEVAMGVVEKEVGRDAFAEFDPEPFAAASIGQVHAATLRDGRRVAVKVQYPGIDAAIRADLANAELLATFLRVMGALAPQTGRLNTRELAAEISARIGEEIDYRIEARNQTDFADAYRGHPFIRVPEVVPELSTARVLTMERVDGLRFAAALEHGQDLRDLWGEVIYRFSLGSLRLHGLFNADPHPGNYLFHEDGTVTFLDFSCVRRFAPRHVAWLRRLVQVVVDGDADALLELYVGEGWLDPSDSPEADMLLAWSRESLRPLVAPQPFAYTRRYAAELVRTEYSPTGPYGDIIRKLTVPPDYTLLGRIDLGMTAVLGELNATGPWEAIRREWDCGGAPATPFGEKARAFWEGS